MDGGLPLHVFAFAKADRQPLRDGVAIARRSAKLRPVIAGGEHGGSEEEESSKTGAGEHAARFSAGRRGVHRRNRPTSELTPPDAASTDRARSPVLPVMVFTPIRAALQHTGSIVWLLVHTVQEMGDMMLRGRFPFRLSIFFHQTDRAGVGSMPLVALVSFFIGLTMALLTGYLLRTFGQERLVPQLVGDRLHPRTRAADDRHHARRPDRRGLHGGARHDDGLRGSRGDRSHGPRAAAVSRQAAGARRFPAHALPRGRERCHGDDRRGADLALGVRHSLPGLLRKWHRAGCSCATSSAAR